MTTTALAALRAEPHVSVSAITCYLRCPRQYEHRYIRKTPPAHTPAALAFGSAIHVALAAFYRSLMDGAEISPTELHTTFADAWTQQLGGPLPVLFDKNDTPDSLLAKGLDMVTAFYAQAERPHRVVGCEEPFSVELTEPETGEALPVRLVGVLDAIVQDTSCRYTILEHKTAARRWAQTRLDYDLQLTAYHLVAPAVGLGDADITVQLLLKSKVPALELLSATRTAQAHYDFLHVVTGVLAAIDAGAFFPRRDWQCSGCQFAAACIAG